MPIEFLCIGCRRTLSVPDDTPGEEARCPECGSVNSVPIVGNGAATLPATFAPTLIQRDQVLSATGEFFGRQWGRCMLLTWTGILAGPAIGFAVTMAASLIVSLLLALPALALGRISEGYGRIIGAISVLVAYVGMLFILYLTVFFSAGIGRVFLKVARGEQPGFRDLLAGRPYVARLLTAAVRYFLIVLGGLCLLIVPGIVWSLMFSQSFYLILDRDLGVTDSFKASRELTTGNKWPIFWLGLITGLVTILVGVFTVGLGYLFAIPYLGVMGAVIYLAVSGQLTEPTHSAVAQRPADPCHEPQ